MTFVWSDRELSAEQSAAVLEPHSTFLIACPGSGKTRTLTYKCAYELSRLQSTRQRIVAITYTNRAADEIHERIDQLGVESTQLWIGTIHAFCLEWILKPYSIYLPELQGGFGIIDAYESAKLLESLCARQAGVKAWDCGYYFTEDGYHLSCPDPSKHDRIHVVLKDYFEHLSRNLLIDFELILYYSMRLVRTQPLITKLLASMFSWVLVDEYQDTKHIQYEIVAAIIRAGVGQARVFIVGDPNQSIFGSLGGFAMSAKAFSTLCGQHLKEKVLESNYRSSDRVISYFGNFNVYGTLIRGEAPHKDFPSEIVFSTDISRDGLEDEIARLIRRSITEQGVAPNQVCVVAPWWILLGAATRRLSALLPEFHFDGPGMVPFSHDRDNFFYRLARIGLTTASPSMYVRRIRWSGEILRDLANAGAHVSNITAKALLRLSNAIDIAERDGLQYLRLYFDALLLGLDVNKGSFPILKDHYEAFFASSQARIEQLQKQGGAFVTDIEFFRKVFEERNGISVSTIHGVKGAEFDVVIAFGLLDGMVPHFSDEDPDASANKMLYVVASRARKHVYLISERGRRRGGGRGDYDPTPQLLACDFAYDEL
jgi:DNA helicase II / ATP-dependent DNA helicase PcrA